MLIPVQASVSPLKKLEYSEAVTALEKHRKTRFTNLFK
jgi:hypothetical protein